MLRSQSGRQWRHWTREPFPYLLEDTVPKRARRIITAAAVGLTGAALLPTVAFAQEADPVVVLGQQINLLWIIIGAVLVIFMQAGFALVETGFTQAKNAAHVVSTNFAVFGLGMVGFFFVGFPFAFGGFSYGTAADTWSFGLTEPIGEALIGSGNWVFLWQGGWALSGDGITPALLGFFLYMVAFMDTTATIPTGSMAERWKWGSFVIWGLFCGAIFYPLFAAWTWGGGWLAKTWDTMSLGAGYVDFAGSGVVHAVGGAAALAGALVLGARRGKFSSDGTPKAIPGHHIPMAMLGTFILLFGWFGFNAASTFAATDVTFATVATNTAIAGGFGAVATMLWITKRTGKPDPGMMANGMLAGLVAVTAPCAFIAPWAAAVIGLIAGVLVVESVFFVERKLKVDDPVGAISVHGVCGTFGVLAVGIFANGSYGGGWNGSDVTGVKGIIKGSDGWSQLGAQALGVLIIWTVIFGIAFGFFKIQDKISKGTGKGGIRSKEEDEIVGLDFPEMGVEAYPTFVKN
jgi:ammonium transporter, Amt family